MATPGRPVAVRAAWTGFGFFLILAAVILFIIAAIIAFGDAHFTTASGLGYIGLACLAGGMIVP